MALIAGAVSTARPIAAQAGLSLAATAQVRGTAVDATGALIPGATFSLLAADGHTISTHKADAHGAIVFPSLPSGVYRLTATAPGFGLATSADFTLRQEQICRKTVTLQVATEEQLSVTSDRSNNRMDPAKNGSGKQLGEMEIDALSDDSTLMLEQLKAMAGSLQAELYVDGFSDGTLPPKNSIRSIRIDQDPYSAMNDVSPVFGVIQVFTKPGTDQLHGGFTVTAADSTLNARSPFVTAGQPDYNSEQYDESVSGPIRHRASFFLAAQQRRLMTNAAINAIALDSALNQTVVSIALPAPITSYYYAPRVGVRLGANDDLSVFYSVHRNTQQNAGIGQLTMASEAYDQSVLNQTLQITNTQIIGARLVNDTRAQYLRDRMAQTPVSSAPTLIVQGAFLGGGSPLGSVDDRRDRLELQDNLSIAAGRHFVNLGSRLRVARESNRSSANFNGEYDFASLDSYRQTLLGVRGVAPQQFSLTAGAQSSFASVADVGAFVQDDWKIDPRLILSGGLRFESQTGISDHSDFAPRTGFAWAIGRSSTVNPRLTLHGGAGLFYQRFELPNLLRVARLNGVLQRQYVFADPPFYPTVPSESRLGAYMPPSVYTLADGLRAPFTTYANVELQYAFGQRNYISVAYANHNSQHVFLLRNANAPLPGTYTVDRPTSGVRPLGTQQNVNQYASEGMRTAQRIYWNAAVSITRAISLFGFVDHQFSHDDVDDGTIGFPSNPYNARDDYGPSSMSHSWSGYIFATADLPWSLRFAVDAQMHTHDPFNITVNQDLNGDAQFTDRPSYATDLTRSSVVATKWGTFDTSPITGQRTIPRNLGNGPSFVQFNTRLSRAIPYGPRRPATAGSNSLPERRYSLVLTAAAANVLNHTNGNTPVGVLGSPLFGQSTALTGATYPTANRVLNLTLSTHF